jgi:LuxR family maltose regulon positive regulatory protein
MTSGGTPFVRPKARNQASASELHRPQPGRSDVDDQERGTDLETEPLELPNHDITLVTGPAGTGKTTRLRQWYATLQTQGSVPAWLGLEPHHREAPDVESLIDASLHTRHGLEHASSNSDALANVDPRDRVVFVDDLHCIDQVLVDQLVQWFRSLPGERWQVILAGRTAYYPAVRPPVTEVPQLTIRSIGPAELRLDDHIVRDSLARRLPRLSPDAVDHLTKKIDGWAVGIELVSEAVEDRQGNCRWADLPTGSDPRIADYFEQEVLSGLPLSDQEFLIWSAVLSRPTPAICDQVVGYSGSVDRLARLGNLNALVFRDSGRDDCRWVPFAREFLLGRLSEVDPNQEREARRQVLQFCLATHRYDEAVAQAEEAHDWRSIVDVVLDAGLDVIGYGRAADLLAWIELLPPEIVASEPGVAVLAAMALWVQSGDDSGPQIDRWLATATSNPEGRPPSGAGSLSCSIDTARAAFGQLDPRTRRLLAQRAIDAETGPETAWTALAWTAAGIALYLNDELRAARHALAESLRVQSGLAVETRRSFSRLFSPAVLAVLALIEVDGKGYADRANALISTAELQLPRTAVSSPGQEILTLAKTRAALAAGDRDAALELSLDAGTHCQLYAFRALGLLDAASIYSEHGQSKESSACLEEADRLIADSGDLGQLVAKRRRAIERQVQLGRAARSTCSDTLTEREAEVLQLLDSDLSRREMGEQLYLSFETVKTYVQRLYLKLGVSSRSAAVATARSWGWLEDSSANVASHNLHGRAGADDRPQLGPPQPYERHETRPQTQEQQ